MSEAERFVCAQALRIGDVVQHPGSCQWGQVAELHGYPETVYVITLDQCLWSLPPDTLMRLHHRTVTIES